MIDIKSNVMSRITYVICCIPVFILLFAGQACYSRHYYYEKDEPLPPLVDSWPSNFIIYNDMLYFSANTGTNASDQTRKLYSYDGVNPPEVVFQDTIDNPYFTIVNNRIILLTYVIQEGCKIYSYDGTNLSFLLNLADYNLDFIFYLKGFNNTLYFDATYEDRISEELWSYDFVNDPSPVYNFEGEIVSRPIPLLVYNNALFLYASNNGYYTELWKYDGTNPAALTKDINESGSSHPGSPCVYNSKLFFSADDGVHGREMWMIDGSSDPVLFYDLNPGPESSFIGDFTEFDGKLYFSANDGVYGHELWCYDEVNGFVMIHDSISSKGGLQPAFLIVFNDKLYFRGYDDTHGLELWCYDGSNPPSMVYDIFPGKIDGFPFSFIVFKDKLYFVADDGVHGLELWSYDGINDPSVAYDIIVPYE